MFFLSEYRDASFAVDDEPLYHACRRDPNIVRTTYNNPELLSVIETTSSAFEHAAMPCEVDARQKKYMAICLISPTHVFQLRGTPRPRGSRRHSPQRVRPHSPSTAPLHLQRQTASFPARCMHHHCSAVPRSPYAHA
eukprot:1142635-Pleurochrysis_carterae.AAC.1